MISSLEYNWASILVLSFGLTGASLKGQDCTTVMKLSVAVPVFSLIVNAIFLAPAPAIYKQIVAG
jgi:hypothetical protein